MIFAPSHFPFALIAPNLPFPAPLTPRPGDQVVTRPTKAGESFVF